MMNKTILQVSLLVGSIAMIASSVVAETIKSGKYQTKYPDNLGIKIEKNQYSVYYDDTAPDPAAVIPKGSFKYIKSGTFYNSKDKKYYCLLRRSQLQAKNSTAKGFTCTRTGWSNSN
jgi:hypothetical protein